MRKLSILVFVILLLPVWVGAATYYVRNDGHDTASGANNTTDGTTGAWQTLSKAQATATTGDTVKLKDDHLWREQFTIPASTFTLTHTGDGTNLPKIYGSTQVSTWENESGNLWYATCATDPNSVWIVKTDGTIIWAKEQATKGALAAEYDWWYDAPNTRIYLYAATDPDIRYTYVEKPTRNYCIYSSGKNNVTISYIDTSFSGPLYADGYGAIYIINSTSPIVEYCKVHHNGVLEASDPNGNGIYLTQTTNQIVRYNTVSHNARRGIITFAAQNNVSNAIIEHNTCFNNYHSQIDNFITVLGASDVWTFDGLTIRYNSCYLDSDFSVGGLPVLPSSCGISLGGPGNTSNTSRITNVKIYNNICVNLWNNPAINVIRTVNGVEIYNNTVYGKYTGSTASTGIYTGSDRITNAKIKNNIGLNTYGNILEIAGGDASIASAADVDYNLWYKNTEAGSPNWVTVPGHTNSPYISSEFAAYKSETGFDAHGLWVDPLFVIDGTDLHLQATSPAKDAGTNLASVGVTDDFAGITRPQGAGYDIGAYEYGIPGFTGTLTGGSIR